MQIDDSAAVRTALHCGLCFYLTVALAGCALNPVSRRPEFVLVTTTREKEIGQVEAQKVEKEVGLVADPALAAYIASVGQRLAVHSPRQDIEYAFAVADTPDPNAFSLPGGYVYVTRGLLVLINSEDELAGVIGHEIGHVAARHAVQRVSRAAPFAIVTNLSAAVTGIASPLLGQVVGGVGQLAAGLVLAPYSRDQEREADRVGQELTAKAGWDPAAISAFLRTLEREEGLHNTHSRRFTFLDSHPATPERVANTAAYARGLQPAPNTPASATRAEFLARLDGLVVGARAADGVFEDQTFLHPDFGFSMRFPDKWLKENSRENVIAVAPDGNAFVVLDTAARGEDPLDGAHALQKASGVKVIEQTQPTTINGLKAARLRTQTHAAEGDVSVDVVWIAHRGTVFQITGMTPLTRREAFTPVFDEVSQSFRPLQPAERAGIREAHLRILEARRDETLDALVARAKTSWSLQMTAVANALSADARLEPGQRVKVAVPEPYESSSSPVATSGNGTH